MGYNLTTTVEVFAHKDNQDWLASAEGVDRADSVTIDAAAMLRAFPDGEVPSGCEISRDPGNGRYVPGVRAASAALAAPGGVAATPLTTGGSLPAATYSYRVTARNSAGETLPSAAVSAITTGATGMVSVTWTAVPGATSYSVYGRTAGAELLLATVTDTAYTDTGRTTPAGPLPTANTTALAASDRPGYLLFGCVVKPGVNAVGALLWHGEVITAKVPIGVGMTPPVQANHPQVRLV